MEHAQPDLMLTILDSALGAVRGKFDAVEILVMAWDAIAVSKPELQQTHASSIA